MRRFAPAIIASLLLASSVWADSQPGALKAVEEEDGSPSCFGYLIKVSNTTLTDNADGTCSVSIPAGSGWTDDGASVSLTTNTDNVILGSDTALGKLGIDGDTDEIQLQVQGFSTQTTLPLVVEQSDGTDVFTVSNAGAVVSATLDTGQGPNELYDMNQNVQTTDDVTFKDITSTGTNPNITLQHTGGDAFGFHTEAGSRAYLNNETDGVHYLHFGAGHELDLGGGASGALRVPFIRLSTDGTGNDEVQLPVDSIGSAEIAADAVGNSVIAADAVGTSEIATDGVEATEIAAGAVGASEIASGAVDAGDMATTGTIADDKVFVADSATAATWRTVTECTDTGGNHLNYTQSTNSFSCGTSSASTANCVIGTFTRDLTAASGTVTISGLGITPDTVFVIPGQADKRGGFGVSNSTTDYSMTRREDSPFNWTVNSTYAINFVTDGSNLQQGNIGNFVSGAFDVVWTKTGTPTAGTADVFYVACNI